MSLTSTSDWPKNLRWFCPCRIENTIMREFLFAFRFLLILFMIARVDAASAQSVSRGDHARIAKTWRAIAAAGDEGTRDGMG